MFRWFRKRYPRVLFHVMVLHRQKGNTQVDLSIEILVVPFREYLKVGIHSDQMVKKREEKNNSSSAIL